MKRTLNLGRTSVGLKAARRAERAATRRVDRRSRWRSAPARPAPVSWREPREHLAHSSSVHDLKHVVDLGLLVRPEPLKAGQDLRDPGPGKPSHGSRNCRSGKALYIAHRLIQ
jgi:hypothetical protein